MDIKKDQQVWSINFITKKQDREENYVINKFERRKVYARFKDKIRQQIQLKWDHYLLKIVALNIYYLWQMFSPNVMRCVIWQQTLKNGVLTLAQNAILTSWNALEAFLSIRLYGIQTFIQCLTIPITCTSHQNDILTE